MMAVEPGSFIPYTGPMPPIVNRPGISQPIKIAHARISVIALSPAEASATARFGDFCPIMHVIRIRSDLPPAEQARVLIHEIIHGCFEAFDLPRVKLDEEDVCEALDGPLTTVLTDNPWLIGVIHQATAAGRPIVNP